MSDITTLMMGAAGQVSGEYQISRSLRFNSADSAYLSRTPASAGNRKTWTWSGWIKKAKSNENELLFSARQAASPYFVFGFSSDSFYMIGDTTSATSFTTTQKFRDPSAWYHIVVAIDTTQATSTDRVKIYVNGVQVTSFTSSSYPGLNNDTNVNAAVKHGIGYQDSYGWYFNGYLADINFIDGQALTPSSFGETDEVTGVWKPKAYAGTYGTNGFHLDFSDNSSTTALGYDAAGSNDWTPNNFSVTAGAGNDSLVDTPTQYGDDTGAGGEVRGNYCTLNPLFKSKDGGTTSNGNLNYAGTRAAWDIVCGTIGMTSGKWYWEVSANQSTYCMAGITSSLVTLESNYFNSGDTYGYNADLGTKYSGNIGTNQAYGASWNGLNDICGVAFDADNMELTFYKNGVSQGVAYTTANFPTDGRAFFPAVTCYDTSTATFNFGQRPFAYTAPSGFKALVTTNLPDPTVVQGDDHFNTVLYTANDSTLAITGVGFQPDLTWFKIRSSSGSPVLFDAVRGHTLALATNQTAAEVAAPADKDLVSWDTDGFTLGPSNDNWASVNETVGTTHVAWNWKANGAGSSNTDGSITSTVSANTTAGISIVRWDGNGGGAATIGHGLGAVPKMIINKGLDFASAWSVYHASAGNTGRLTLNTTDAFDTNSGFWNNTTPTSSVFTVGNIINQATPYDYVAYCFAEVEGFSKFGSYTGNGSADGPFVYTGFRPAFVMAKDSTVAGQEWTIYDAKRDTYNAVRYMLSPTFSQAESNATSTYDFLSNGFKLRSADLRENRSGSTFIYAAFSSNPFKTSLAR